MAIVDPRDALISREDIGSWLQEFTGTSPQELRAFLKAKIDATQPNLTVDTRGMASWPDYTLAVDMVMADLDSYGFTYPDAASA